MVKTKHPAQPTVFEVAMLLKALEEQSASFKMTKEEWVSEQSQLGCLISFTVLGQALTMAEIKEDNIFTTPTVRLLQMADQVRMHEIRIEKLENLIGNKSL